MNGLWMRRGGHSEEEQLLYFVPPKHSPFVFLPKYWSLEMEEEPANLAALASPNWEGGGGGGRR